MLFAISILARPAPVPMYSMTRVVTVLLTTLVTETSERLLIAFVGSPSIVVSESIHSSEVIFHRPMPPSVAKYAMLSIIAKSLMILLGNPDRSLPATHC